MTGSLFPDEPGISPRELARGEHPATSHEAARRMATSGLLGERMAETLALLKANPCGLTASELERKAGVSDGRFRKRLNDLRKRGLAWSSGTKRCEVTGRNAGRWWC